MSFHKDAHGTWCSVCGNAASTRSGRLVCLVCRERKVVNVRREHVTPLGLRDVITEASTLGLPPGFWPETLVLVWEPGATEVFAKERLNYAHGEVLSVNYKSAIGTVLVVLND
jgi:hypothetical protein